MNELPQILHYRNQGLVLYTETQLLIIKQFILLNRLKFNTLKLESCRMFFMFCEKWIEIHSLVPVFARSEIFLAQEKVHVDLLFTFFHLPSDVVHRFIENLKNVDCSVDVHYFTAHRDHHRTQKNPRFFLHFRTHHEGRHEVNFLKFDWFFGRSSFASTSHIARNVILFRYDELAYRPVAVFMQVEPALGTELLISSQTVNLFL